MSSRVAPATPYPLYGQYSAHKPSKSGVKICEFWFPVDLNTKIQDSVFWTQFFAKVGPSGARDRSDDQ